MTLEEQTRIFRGVWWVMVGHALVLLLSFAGYLVAIRSENNVDSIGVWLMWRLVLLLGLTQLLYVVPMGLWLKRRRRFATLKGVMLAAIATLLLNGGCYLIPGAFTFLSI